MRRQRSARGVVFAACGVLLAASATAEPVSEGAWTYDANCRIWEWDSSRFDGVTLEVLQSSASCRNGNQPDYNNCLEKLAVDAVDRKSRFVDALVAIKTTDPRTWPAKSPKCLLQGTEGGYAKVAVENFVRQNLEAEIEKQIKRNLTLFLTELQKYESRAMPELAKEVLKQMQSQPDFDKAVAEAVKRVNAAPAPATGVSPAPVPTTTPARVGLAAGG